VLDILQFFIYHIPVLSVCSFLTMPEHKPTFGSRVLIGIFKGVNKLVSWHKLPKYVGVLNLLAYRDELRAKNLYDTYPNVSFQGSLETCPMSDTKYLSIRESDGKFNDLKRPRMGCAGMRFGRNVPRKDTKPPTHEELLNPNPRIISERLLARQPGEFKPATIVNLLAAAWIQFQTHDWFAHVNSTEEQVDIPLPTGDKWSDPQMVIPRTQADKPLDKQDEETPAYRNENTAWWDGSQIYGSSEAKTTELRGEAVNGKLMLDHTKTGSFLPRDSDGLPDTGFNNNWWIGLELMHTLFALEHNAICDVLHEKHAEWSSDQLFDTARLVNCALMAKIHTVEWTPAILDHPTLQVSMDANWWGLTGEKFHKLVGRIAPGEIISGIPGSGADQDGVPYSLTEEFVSVYRMHPLIPDNIAFFTLKDGKHTSTVPIQDLAFTHARDPLLDPKNPLDWADLIYSFGINYPGAITYRNTPSFLRDLHLPDGSHFDMGVVDILRDRERGVPRYNAFRRLFHLPPMKSFKALTGGDTALAAELCEIYNDDIEKVDLLIGTLCEPKPKGFGFSDTAFRVFILMASRRLKSDRFIATDFKPEIYGQEGYDWVQNNTMVDLLCRHFPGLRGPLDGCTNAFRPWNKIGQTAEYKGVETTAPK
jgi:hypothetical protein